VLLQHYWWLSTTASKKIRIIIRGIFAGSFNSINLDLFVLFRRAFAKVIVIRFILIGSSGVEKEKIETNYFENQTICWGGTLMSKQSFFCFVLWAKTTNLKIIIIVFGWRMFAIGCDFWVSLGRKKKEESIAVKTESVEWTNFCYYYSRYLSISWNTEIFFRNFHPVKKIISTLRTS